MAIFKLICFAASLIQIAESTNIVSFFGVSSYSHRVAAWPLLEALADNGHNITFISPYPAKSPNPKVFDYNPNALYKWVERLDQTIKVFEDRKNKDNMNLWLKVPAIGKMMCEEIYKDDEYINWVKSTKVELVILNALGNDCAYGMIEYWGAKVILFDTSAPFGYFTEAYGLPDETSWIPSLEFSDSIVMSLSQRLLNALVPVALHYYRKWTFFPSLEAITIEKLGITNVPKFEELERNESLVFINTHFGEEFARSLPPNVIPIGGIAYTAKRKALPKEMESFLDKGDGFIYMSFGTYADFLRFDTSIQRAFIGTMQNLSHIQFVWKVDSDSFIKEFPKNNVYISSWMPQQDILAHPKIRAFITHAGLLGIQEAIYHSVPLISFPIFSEQDYNAVRIHETEYGIRLEITSVTQSQIEDALQKILTEKKYRLNMKKVSAIFTDRRQKPLETALWWTEFVIRHSKEDIAALRPSSVGQSWWKRRQLDVWATILAGVTVFLCVTIYVMYTLVKFACRKNSSMAKPLTKPIQKKKIR